MCGPKQLGMVHVRYIIVLIVNIVVMSKTTTRNVKKKVPSRELLHDSFEIYQYLESLKTCLEI